MITVTLRPGPYLETLATTGQLTAADLPTGTTTLPGIPSPGHHLTHNGRRWVVDAIDWTGDSETIEIVLS